MVRKDIPPLLKRQENLFMLVPIQLSQEKRFDSKVISEIQSIYRIPYQKYNNTQAVKIIEGEMEATKERDEIIQFIQNSQRGIMKGYLQS